jgi:hypothetical protein
MLIYKAKCKTQYHEAVGKPAEIISTFTKKKKNSAEKIGRMFTSHYHNSARNHTIWKVNKISQNTVNVQPLGNDNKKSKL